MNKSGVCVLCGEGNTELHHIIYKSRCKSLANCEGNLIELCHNCHRGTYGVHNNGKLDKELRDIFKIKCLKSLKSLYGDIVTVDTLGIYLCISDKEVYKLTKDLRKIDGDKISLQDLSYKLGLGEL